MGYTIDIFNADFSSEKHALTFVGIFNEMLLDDLCGSYSLCDRDVQRIGDSYHINIEGSPLFVDAERGDQLTPVIERFLKENQDAEFSAHYSCAFSNCGDTTYIDFEYNDGVLTVDTRWGEMPYETYCEECDYDSEEDFEDEDEEIKYLVDLETWEPDKEYRCPQCGAIIEFEATRYVEEIPIIEN